MGKVSTFELMAFLYGMVEAYYIEKEDSENFYGKKDFTFPIILSEIIDAADGGFCFDDYIADNFSTLAEEGVRYVETLFEQLKSSDFSTLESTYLATLHRVMPKTEEEYDS